MTPSSDAPAPTPASPSDVAVEIRRGTELLGIEPAWRALFVEAIEPNPFLGPDFLAPLARLREGRFQVALAWRGAGTRRVLAALMPLTPEPGIAMLRPPILRAFRDPLVVDATPLVATEGAGEALAALLAGLARHHPGAVLALDGIRVDGPIAAAIAASGAPYVLARRTERAAVRARPAGAPFEGRMADPRLGELRRREAQLAQAGRVETVILRGAAAAPAVEAFLALEARGRAGREGTALAADPRHLAFARQALSGTTPGVAAALMTLDGSPIAAAVHLLAGDEAVAFGRAHDERWDALSPDALLDLHLVATALDSGQLAVLDSGLPPDDPAEGLWSGRIAHGELLVALDRGTRAADLEALVRRLASIEALGRTARDLVKRTLGRSMPAARRA